MGLIFSRETEDEGQKDAAPQEKVSKSSHEKKRKRKQDDTQQTHKKQQPASKKQKEGASILTPEQRWDEMLKRLKAYKRQNGNCSVPSNYTEDKELAGWVTRQRVAFKANKLAAERKKKLDSLDFVFASKHRRNWREMFDKLKEYKKHNGHCRVPAKYKSDQPFANWVVKQRRTFQADKLKASRKKQLDSVGFIWEDYDDTVDS